MATMTRPRQSHTVRWREDRELPVQCEQEKARQSRHTRSLRSISAMQLRMQQNELDCTGRARCAALRPREAFKARRVLLQTCSFQIHPAAVVLSCSARLRSINTSELRPILTYS